MYNPPIVGREKNRILEKQRLAPGSSQEYEVEVPLREQSAKNLTHPHLLLTEHPPPPSPCRRGRGKDGEGVGEVRKSDRSADASGAWSQAPFSLPEKAHPRNGFKKKNSVARTHKTTRQRMGQMRRSDWQAIAMIRLEGLPT